jgi:hypothetical protein
LDPGRYFSINRWSLYAPGTTYFLPIIETTALTISALLELFGEDMGVFLRDERAWYRPAGISRFARSRGGNLHDDPRDLRSATIQMMESSLLESMATEHGMVLQNLALMTEALGLGGFPNFARHEYSWFKAAGFRMQSMSASRYARRFAACGYTGALAGKRSRVGISSRIGTGQPDTFKAILPALLQINGGCGRSISASEVRGRWKLPRWNSTECLA